MSSGTILLSSWKVKVIVQSLFFWLVTDDKKIKKDIDRLSYFCLGMSSLLSPSAIFVSWH